MANPNAAASRRLKRILTELADPAEVKDGKALITMGYFHGRKIGIVVRNSDHVFRGGATSLTEASEKRSLCWMLDTSTIPMLQDFYELTAVATFERNTGDIWVSKMSDWTDPEKLYVPDSSIMRPTYRRASLTYLPLAYHRESPNADTLLFGARRAKTKSK